MKVKDKIMVVTGGGNGLGRELVLALLNRGATVAAIDINSTALEETVRLAGDHMNKITTYTVNLTDREAVAALPEQIVSQLGAVDGIINNAGIIQPFVKLNNLDYDAIKRVFDINFFGTLYMTKAFLPCLLKRPEAHIINISSMGGFFPFPGQTVYGASKAAVKILTEGLYSELINTRVRITVVFPGGISTGIAGNSGLRINESMENLQRKIKLLSPQKAAQIIIKGIENNRYRMFVGIDAALMNFIYKFSPRHAVKLINQLMKSILTD